MIRVHVVVVPHGIEHKKELVAELEIVNELTHPMRPEYGNYRCEGTLLGDHRFPLPQVFEIKGHKRSDGIISLVKKAMEFWEWDMEGELGKVQEKQGDKVRQERKSLDEITPAKDQ